MYFWGFDSMSLISMRYSVPTPPLNSSALVLYPGDKITITLWEDCMAWCIICLKLIDACCCESILSTMAEKLFLRKKFTKSCTRFSWSGPSQLYVTNTSSFWVDAAGVGVAGCVLAPIFGETFSIGR